MANGQCDGPKAGDALYLERELTAMPAADLADYTRLLMPTIAPEDARELVRISGGQLEALLRVTVLLLRGTAVRDLPQNPLEDAYDKLILRLRERRSASDWRELKDALLVLALVGSVDLGDEGHRNALESAGVTPEALGNLVDLRTADRNKAKYSLGLDTFRAHIVRRALNPERADILSGTPELCLNSASQ